VAEDQVGVGDSPPSTNFGLDCNPFTTLAGVGASSSGCGTDPKFNVLDENEEWCADFTKWVWEQGGVTADLSALTPAAASFYQWALDQGQHPQFDSGIPAPGDAVVFYPSSDSAPNASYADHVGIITAVNSNGTLNLVNGDFLGSTNITVQANDSVSLTSWAASVWGSGEQWILVSPGTYGLPGGPAVYDPSSGNLEVYGTGTDTTLRQIAWNPSSGWSPWQDLGGSITGRPAAIHNPVNNNMDVFVTAAGGQLYEDAWNPSSGWSWQDLGGSITGSPAAVYNPVNNDMDVLVTAAGTQLYEDAWNSSSGWSWQNLGGSLASP
jgi:hypothetical protein